MQCCEKVSIPHQEIVVFITISTKLIYWKLKLYGYIGTSSLNYYYYDNENQNQLLQVATCTAWLHFCPSLKIQNAYQYLKFFEKGAEYIA